MRCYHKQPDQMQESCMKPGREIIKPSISITDIDIRYNHLLTQCASYPSLWIKLHQKRLKAHTLVCSSTRELVQMRSVDPLSSTLLQGAPLPLIERQGLCVCSTTRRNQGFLKLIPVLSFQSAAVRKLPEGPERLARRYSARCSGDVILRVR